MAAGSAAGTTADDGGEALSRTCMGTLLLGGLGSTRAPGLSPFRGCPSSASSIDSTTGTASFEPVDRQQSIRSDGPKWIGVHRNRWREAAYLLDVAIHDLFRFTSHQQQSQFIRAHKPSGDIGGDVYPVPHGIGSGAGLKDIWPRAREQLRWGLSASHGWMGVETTETVQEWYEKGIDLPERMNPVSLLWSCSGTRLKVRRTVWPAHGE